MRVYQFLILYVGLGTLGPALLHYYQNNVISHIQIALSFFLALNCLICVWEIALGLHISHIAEDYRMLSKKYEKNRFSAVTDLMFFPLSLSDTFSLKFWSRIWSTYSLYDPSYSNKESFGFFVDVGECIER
jgi:hypothetical protein